MIPESLKQAWTEGRCVPVLGPDALTGVTDQNGNPIPADSDSLILAMNNGRPMAPKLMYEFPRAAMNIELKKGRKAVTRFLDTTYRDTQWSVSPLHQAVAELDIPYLIDMNRDTQMQELWQDRPHILVVGVARIGGGTARYRLYLHQGEGYIPLLEEAVDPDLPVLFKPLGSPLPESHYIASDADYVDYLTELMGGFGMPAFLKMKREGMSYLLLGMPLNRDTGRMLINDITYAAGTPTGWSCRGEVSGKEEKFLQRHGIELLALTPAQCLEALNVVALDAEGGSAEDKQTVLEEAES